VAGFFCAQWLVSLHAQGIYEYGDHGGLLLLASHETEGPADSLTFSLDQGACWHTIRLQEAIDIQNIRCAEGCSPQKLAGSLFQSLWCQNPIEGI
jgi:hypothetical protein